MIAKLRQVEDKEVVCTATVFSLFLFLIFILFLPSWRVFHQCLVAHIAYGIISERDEVGQFISFLVTVLELLLGRSLHNNSRSRVENFMAVTDENEATDFGGTADARATHWVPENNTVHHLDNELRAETLTTVI